MQGGYGIAFTERFKKDYKSLSPDLQNAVDDCIADLAKDPIPASRRAHRINAGQFPKVFSLDVTSNKSHKLSFEIIGNQAVLRRIGTHREIDRSN
jgi:mRNA-degrading endonuclease YafQ of YafQ-DinJ toxin-antitoxin module